MARNVKIDGAYHEINGGMTKVGSTYYEIGSGKTRIDNTLCDVGLEKWYKVCISSYLKDRLDCTYIRINGEDYNGEQPIEVKVLEGTPIECRVINRVSGSDSIYATPYGCIYINNESEVETYTSDETITYTHIVDSHTYIYAGTQVTQSGITNEISLVDDGRIIFTLGTLKWTADNGMTWEGFCESNTSVPISCVDGRVQITMGITLVIVYADGTFVNPKDKILPLYNYSVASPT